jgi:Ser/Thr protein kinase RdoA (MazF antagonist)
VTSPPQSPHPYDSLTPDAVLDAIEAAGYRPTGTQLALNSYENRVYMIGEETAGYLIAKFYRPGRWSDAQIHEEHAFSLELAELEIPVVAPLANADGDTLLRHTDFRFALFPRRGGHAPELGDPDTQYRLGQFIGRIHAVGATHAFRERPALTPQRFGHDSIDYLLGHDAVPREYVGQYRDLATELMEEVDARFAATPYLPLRLHGDLHAGNILWTDTGAHLVDLDDSRMGPAIQDIWLLLSGDRPDMQRQLGEILAGYEEFHEFDRRELALVEPLRTLRLLHYAAWLARRWSDPAFPKAFPWFNTLSYWEEQILTLREQRLRLQEPTLQVA